MTRSLRPLRALAVVPLLIALLVGCQPERKDPALVQRILLVGDSITHGALGTPGIRTYLGEFFPNAQIVTLGGPATSPVDNYDPTTGWSDWAGQVNHWVASGFDADLVVIQGCCNDFTSASQWRGAIDAVIGKARGHDPGGDRRVVLVTTARIVPGTAPYYEAFGIDDMIDGSNAVIRETGGVAIADVDFAWSVNWGPVWLVPNIGVTRYADGLHLTHPGARSMAQLISQA